MAKKIKQIRYYNDESQDNFPVGLTSSSLLTGKAFNKYIPIVQLGIQALPGTKFYINGGEYPIIMGYTGIYEIDSGILHQITKLQFDATSLNLIQQNDNAYIIIDLIYEG